MSALTISLRTLHALVDPVIPFASDDYQLPTLNAVRIESRGKYLLAFSADRFRLACQRVAAEEGATWPEWSATIPLATLRSLFQTYKAKRFAEPQVTLTIDGDSLRVHGDEALIDLLDASVTYPLTDGEFPKVGSLISKAIAETDDVTNVTAFNPKLLADFSRTTRSPVLAMRLGATGRPVLFADGDDFVGLLMPRKREGMTDFPALTDWDDLLNPPAPAKKRAPRKARKAVA